MTAPDPTADPDYRRLMAGVLADPGDDLARLVLADWLEERGEWGRARHIRQHVEDPRRYDRQPGDPALYRAFDPPTGRTQTFVLADAVPGVSFTTSRGFVSGIACDLATFLRHAGDLFAAHPITAVRLTDRRPEMSGGNWWYYLITTRGHDSPTHLPDVLLKHFPVRLWYMTEADALAGLSSACVAFGRDLAGLPPLSAPAPAR